MSDAELWALLARCSDPDLARLLGLLLAWDAMRGVVVASGVSGEWVNVDGADGE